MGERLKDIKKVRLKEDWKQNHTQIIKEDIKSGIREVARKEGGDHKKENMDKKLEI